jgi:hypothetical protein
MTDTVETDEAAAMLGDYLRSNGYAQPEDAAQLMQVTMLREWIGHLCTVLHEETSLNREAKMRVIRAMIYGAVPRESELALRKSLAALRMQDIARYGFAAGTGQAPG